MVIPLFLLSCYVFYNDYKKSKNIDIKIEACVYDNCTVKEGINWYVLIHLDEKLNFSKPSLTLPQYDVNYILSGEERSWRPLLLSKKALLHCKLMCKPFERVDCGNRTDISFGYYNRMNVLNDKVDKTKLESILLGKLATLADNHACFTTYAFNMGKLAEVNGNYTLAIDWYQKRSKINDYGPQVFYSLYRLAVSYLKTNGSKADAAERLFLKAHDHPHGTFRKEPLYYLARMHRSNGNFTRCLLYSSAGMNTPSIPPDSRPIFLEHHIYNWALEEEHAVCLYHSGHTQLSKNHFKNILYNNKKYLPPDALNRILKSLNSF